MIPRTTMRAALADPELLGNVLAGESWQAWRILLIAAMGEPLTEAERVLFKQLTGRDREPDRPVEEFAGVTGRRGGKSRAISVVATYIAGLCEHPTLVPGERGVCLIVAPDQKQADIVLDYCEANFRASPILSQLIEQRTQRELRLTNGIILEVRASDFRRLRGPSYVCVICDEVAFFMSDGSANPDSEILAACRPGLSTTAGPLFLISSPYARRGELWRTFNRHFGPAGDPLILVAQGSSGTFNPTLPQSVVDRAYERDPVSAAAEYGAEFRRDIETFVPIEVVNACVSHGVFERAPQPGVSYVGFTDPSGGSIDSFTLAIAHNEIGRQTLVIDALREVRPPFSPEQVCAEFATLLKTYGIFTVVGDKYAGIWPVEMLSRVGMNYEQSAQPKSELYQGLLPLLNSCRIELLDHPRLVSQLCALERRTARSGRDTIDHAPGGHDDIVNSVAGAAAAAIGRYGAYDPTFRGWNEGDFDSDLDANEQWRRARLAAYLLSGGNIVL